MKWFVRALMCHDAASNVIEQVQTVAGPVLHLLFASVHFWADTNIEVGYWLCQARMALCQPCRERIFFLFRQSCLACEEEH